MNEYTFDSIEKGKTESFKVTITSEMMDSFLKITKDINPLHNEMEYAVEMGHPSKVVYGMLTASFLSTLVGVYLPGKYSLIHTVETEFVKPVYIGDELTVTGTVTDLDENFKVIWLRVVIVNQDSKKILRGKMRVGLYK